MTSSIPDSLSTADLQKMMEDALPEVQTTSMVDASPEDQISRVVNAIEKLSDEWGTIFAYKLIADYSLHQLFLHHKEVAKRSADDAEMSAAWSRDAGQFQVIGRTLRAIQCGTGDFIADDN